MTLLESFRLGPLHKWIRGRQSAELGPIGIELADHSLGMVQFRRQATQLKLVGARSISIDSPITQLIHAPSELIRLLGDARKGFSGRRAVVSMPTETIKLMAVNYRSDDDDAAMILRLVRERVNEPLEDLVLDYVPVRTASAKSGERSAIVAVARRRDVWQVLELFRHAGLRVDHLEIGPTGLRRLITFGLQNTPDAGNVVILRSFGDRSSLLLFWGRRMLLYRDLDFSDHELVERVGKSLDMPSSTARSLLEEHGVAWNADQGPRGGLSELRSTLHEILRPKLRTLMEPIEQAETYLASTTHGESLERVYLLSAMSSWPGARELLHELFGERFASAGPADFLCVDPAQRDEFAPLAEELDIASGLALRGIADHA